MAEFIHSVHQDSVAVGASDTTIRTSMPVLPLSHILITLDFELDTANDNDAYLNALDAMSSVQFTRLGTQIYALRGSDLYRIARAMGIWYNRPEVVSNAVNSRRLLTLCMPFGRKLWSPTECFPAVNKGETELAITFTANPTTYNDLILTVESVQLPEANPANFVRCTTITDTPAATGNKDYDLPRNAPLLGLGYVNTASEPGSATATIEDIKILANNQEQGYSQIKNNTARVYQGMWSSYGQDFDTWTHVENIAGAYAQNAITNTQRLLTGAASEFGWLPFDPTKDGMYMLNAPSYQDLKARITFNTAAAIRILPVEFWTPNMLSRLPARAK